MSLISKVKTAAAAATAVGAAAVVGLSVGDAAIADLGIQLPGLDLGERLAEFDLRESVGWWFLENPDDDLPVRILFLYFREY